MKQKHAELVKILAQNLKRYRADLKLSQEDLADLAGMSRDFLAGIETCRDTPSLGMLTQIADALKVSVPELLSGPESHPSRVEDRIELLLQHLTEDDKEIIMETISSLAHSLRQRHTEPSS